MPTLEGIRTEIARLAAQNYPALRENNVEMLYTTSLQDENQCRALSPKGFCEAIALAQQMRGWFETLGYNKYL